jgi:hypothetical protein
LRESWGWQRKGGQVQLWTRPLSPQQLAALTGLSTDHLKRDLQTLGERGILRQEGQRYQLVPYPQLWITPRARAPKLRPVALKPPGHAAKTALPASDVKIDYKKQRNVSLPVDKSLSSAGAKGSRGITDQSRLKERFCQVVEEFSGPLSAEEREALCAWIEREGLTPVWQALTPAFRRGPTAVRYCLQGRRCINSDPPTL